ncbi:MAG: GGDEF domain-containing protein [Rhodoferax sp.]
MSHAPLAVSSLPDATLVTRPGGVRSVPGVAQSQACFIVVRGARPGQRFVLAAGQMRLGRDSTADILVEDTRVSRRHALIDVLGDEVRLTDTGSTNGTAINGQALVAGQIRLLRAQDLIEVGDTQLKFVPRGDPESHYVGALEDRAQRDTLTGLFNKGYVLDAMALHFARARKLGQPCSLMVVDLDHFKQVNDRLGHDVGDEVLRSTAQTLVRTVADTAAVLGRFGGEEFLVLLDGLDLAAALRQAQAVCQTMAQQAIETQSGPLRVTVSVGVAQIDGTMNDAPAWFRSADQALYQAKGAGRNQVKAAQVRQA